MTLFVNELLNQNKRVLIYNGDIDTICNCVGNDEFVVHDINATLINDNQPWHVKDTLPDVAGFVTRYTGVSWIQYFIMI